MSSKADLLFEAAFGSEPGRWPLPAARTVEERWWRAVAAAGQGRYGAADAELALLRRVASGPRLSLAHSTQGSLLRQLGGHRNARGWDGKALLEAGDDVSARVDALVGLAADALGTGRFALSGTLLAQARDTLNPQAPGRLAVRLAWVGAELAMATGAGDDAVMHARRAVELAADEPSVRHRIKSSVVLAAALCCADDIDAARTGADEGIDATAEHGLVPLRWALASLLAGIGSAEYAPEQVEKIRETAAVLITRRGGHWHDA